MSFERGPATITPHEAHVLAQALDECIELETCEEGEPADAAEPFLTEEAAGLFARVRDALKTGQGVTVER